MTVKVGDRVVLSNKGFRETAGVVTKVRAETDGGIEVLFDEGWSPRHGYFDADGEIIGFKGDDIRIVPEDEFVEKPKTRLAKLIDEMLSQLL